VARLESNAINDKYFVRLLMEFEFMIEAYKGKPENAI